MAEPSEEERRKTRKRRLAAEAAFLLLLLRAFRKTRSSSAFFAALVPALLPIQKLARARLLAELQLAGQVPKPTLRRLQQTLPLGTDALLRLRRIVSRFFAYAQSRKRNASTPSLREQAELAAESRLRIIAANEAARAFEQERRATAVATAKATKAVATKRWDATLDGGTCDECSKLHGTEIPMDDEFPQGDPPLHPNCRCSIEYRFDS